VTDIHTPQWVKHAVFYQIFPDRFARSLRTKHPRGITFKPWGTPPEEQGYQGGDLRGIIDRLDYLQDLGITALYLNPIFSSAANHHYHTYDYYTVDPLLGGNDALRELLDQAHDRGIYVVLDGVFNHASRGFWQFHHVLENGADSPYVDWFYIKDWPLRPYSSDEENHHNYGAWWEYPALPELNTDNPGVRDMIFDIACHWLDFGIDGWRLDVPADIDDDSFWQEFRRVVKRANPEAYICGEIWHEAQRWLGGDQFDAVMNYLFTRNALAFFGADTLRTDWQHDQISMKPLDASTFAENIGHMLGLYDWQINLVQLNLLDSHDMPRALHLLGEDKSALRLCVLFQMTMPGAPCIYYGDEIGMSAAGDPYCRGAFPWDQNDEWDQELLAFYKGAIRLRHQNPVLRTGNFQSLFAEGKIYAFKRLLDRSRAVVVFNAEDKTASVNLELGENGDKQYYQAWPNGGGIHPVENGHLRVDVPARDALVLLR